MEPSITAVFLGRFSPLHKGHQMIIDGMLGKHKKENCLIIVGSSTSLNERTPYTFSQREKMVKTLYPELEVIGLPDINPNKEHFSNDTISEWLDQIKRLEIERNTTFIFYGGSKSDLEYISQQFKTEVLINRKKEGRDFSATEARETKLKSSPEKMIDKRILDIVNKPAYKDEMPCSTNIFKNNK